MSKRVDVKYPLFLSDFNEIWIFCTEFRGKRVQVSSFVKIRQFGNKLFHADRWMDTQTDMTKLIVAFRYFAKAPKNVKVFRWDTGSSFERNQTVEEIDFRQRWSSLPLSRKRPAVEVGEETSSDFLVWRVMACAAWRQVLGLVCIVKQGEGVWGGDYDRVSSCPISHGEKD